MTKGQKSNANTQVRNEPIPTKAGLKRFMVLYTNIPKGTTTLRILTRIGYVVGGDEDLGGAGTEAKNLLPGPSSRFPNVKIGRFSVKNDPEFCASMSATCGDKK